MKPVVLVAALLGSAAVAQAPEEFPLPAFVAPQADAGVEAFDGGPPSAPPLPVLEAAPPPAPSGPPPPPRWTRIAGHAGVLATGLTQAYLGIEVSLLGTVVGTPAPSREALGEAEGWLLQVGAHGAWGRVNHALCRGTSFCATRLFGGLAVRAGWGRGTVSLKDGFTRAQSLYFAQVDLDAAHFDIESAPLSPGRSIWELITRLRVGLQWTSASARVTTTGVTLYGAVLVEAIPLSAGTQTVSLGASAGIGF